MADRNSEQPLSRGGTVPFLSFQHPTLTHLPSASPALTSSNTPHNQQPDEPQPVISTNPIRNAHVGEPFPNQPAPPQPSSSQTDPPTHQTSPSLNNIHHPPKSRSPLTPPTPAHPIAVRSFKPKGILKIGLKQAMGLHDTEKRKHAYNRFRASNFSRFFRCSPTLILAVPGARSDHYETEGGGNVG